jgi:hypothetical protein
LFHLSLFSDNLKSSCQKKVQQTRVGRHELSGKLLSPEQHVG